MEKARRIIQARLAEIIDRKANLIDYEVRYEGKLNAAEQRMNDDRYHELTIIQIELERLLVEMYSDVIQ